MKSQTVFTATAAALFALTTSISSQVTSHGIGCPIGGDMLPYLMVDGEPYVGNDIEIIVTSTPHTYGFFALSQSSALDLGNLPIGQRVGATPCQLLVNPLDQVEFLTDQFGHAYMRLIDLDVGLAFTIQAIFVDPQSATTLGATQVLEIHSQVDNHQHQSSGPLQGGNPTPSREVGPFSLQPAKAGSVSRTVVVQSAGAESSDDFAAGGNLQSGDRNADRPDGNTQRRLTSISSASADPMANAAFGTLGAEYAPVQKRSSGIDSSSAGTASFGDKNADRPDGNTQRRLTSISSASADPMANAAFGTLGAEYAPVQKRSSGIDSSSAGTASFGDKNADRPDGNTQRRLTSISSASADPMANAAFGTLGAEYAPVQKRSSGIDSSSAGTASFGDKNADRPDDNTQRRLTSISSASADPMANAAFGTLGAEYAPVQKRSSGIDSSSAGTASFGDKNADRPDDNTQRRQSSISFAAADPMGSAGYGTLNSSSFQTRRGSSIASVSADNMQVGPVLPVDTGRGGVTSGLSRTDLIDVQPRGNVERRLVSVESTPLDPVGTTYMKMPVPPADANELEIDIVLQKSGSEDPDRSSGSFAVVSTTAPTGGVYDDKIICFGPNFRVVRLYGMQLEEANDALRELEVHTHGGARVHQITVRAFSRR